MSRWLDGQVALVLGGGSGIGAGVASAFVAEGARVGVLDRHDGAERIATELGERALGLRGDATVAAECAAAVEAVEAAFGQLDTLVCCAGIFDFYARLAEMSDADLDAAFDEIFRTNVKSCLVGVRATLGSLQATGGSAILTVSSSAYRAAGGGVLYGASKWAVRGLVAHLANELAPDVRVNGVAPGGTGGTRLSGLTTLGQRQRADTVTGRDERIRDGTALGVLPGPADHASAYVYLASRRAARVVTGAVINSDGGSTL